MNFIKKVSKTLLFVLIIIAILVLIYLAIPKYQIHSVRVDDDTVVVTKINTITGQTITKIEKMPKYSPNILDRFF
ncbi:hypothetical protein ES695_06500 [Candidatus Atribacteria bacterium 1244-E10-H5-B2]|nr:MAG: hypothetical protein ES695_06500 [Candidatus Atribacteria bacterium 1244-E10-H5-B2]